MKTVTQKSSGRVLAMGLSLAFFATTQSKAQNTGDISSLVGAIGLGNLTLAGSGCPQGSVQADLSESGDHLVIRFDDFVAHAGGLSTLDRKACMLALPLTLPQGLRVRTAGITLNGFAFVPDRASARVSIESFFAGSSNAKITKTFSSGFENEFSVSTPSSKRSWSRCGDDVILRANMSVIVKNRNQNEEALIAVTEQHGKNSSYVIDLDISTCN